MPSLVTRFHLLLLTVTLAISGVGAVRIPADFLFLAHWQGSTADWLWPREIIFVAPVLQVVLLVAFFALGRLLTKNQYAKSQHILDPALSTIMGVVVATQLGLLLSGIGSDLDFVRVTAFVLGFALLVLGIVLFEAERHTYAGLRMPWPVRSDRAWRIVHRSAGLAYGVAGMALLALAWFDMGLGLLVLGFAAVLLLPALVAGLATRAFDPR
ncbi:MAG: SdpI family protein [Devosia sp.]